MSEDKSDEAKQKLVVVEEVLATEEKKQEQAPIMEQVYVEEKPNYLWIIIPTALLFGALAGGFITYFSGISKLSMPTSSPVATVPATPVPSPEPEQEFDRGGVAIQVLNGSGIAGMAGKAKTHLESLGYKNVAVGNASKSDFMITEIELKTESQNIKNIIISDLSKNYTLSDEVGTLSVSSKYDIVVTLGKK